MPKPLTEFLIREAFASLFVATLITFTFWMLGYDNWIELISILFPIILFLAIVYDVAYDERV